VEERRRAVRQPVRALIALVAVCGGAQACELPPGVRVESAGVALSYRTSPATIAVGQPFVLELAACARQGTVASSGIRLDAHMPEHRHGMNYRPSLEPLGGGRYRSEGWLFHMPGRWEFIFDMGGERLTHSVRIE
jgi:hypothetical protein